MSEPAPEFDAHHPGGQLLFRSCRGGYLHSVAIGEGALDADAAALAVGVLLTAQVSHLRAVMQVRREIIGAGFTPSDDIAGEADLERAEVALREHRLD